MTMMSVSTQTNRRGTVSSQETVRPPLWSPEQFGRWIAAELGAKGLRPSELTARIAAIRPEVKMSRSYLSLLINATPHRSTGHVRRPSPKVVMAIADALSETDTEDKRRAYRNEALLRAGHAPSDVFEWTHGDGVIRIPDKSIPVTYAEAKTLLGVYEDATIQALRAELDDLRRQLVDQYEAIISAIERGRS